MIIQEYLVDDEIPCYEVMPRAALKHNRSILLYHGLFSRKEDNAQELQWLAQAGFRAIGVDAPGHGSRAQKISRQISKKELDRLVLRAAREIPSILDHLEGLYGEDQEFIVCGISLGGFIAFQSPLWDPRIQTILPILGSPLLLSRNCAVNFISAFEGKRVLAQNAGLDESVPPSAAREFLRNLSARLPAGEFIYREYPSSSHFMLEEDWLEVWKVLLEFLKQADQS